MEFFHLKLSAAYLLDLILGDPQWFLHPVRIIGRLIERGESDFRRWFKSEFAGGLLLTLCLCAGVYVGVHLLLMVLADVLPTLSWVVEIGLIYTCLSTKDLAVESRWVAEALAAENLPLARQKLSYIVGRDTQDMDAAEVVRGAVETIAENSVDGILSPLFYALLGGAPLALTYKTINTLDSMIGHKNARYIQFGKAAAKIDTWVNWLPARITGFLFPLAAGLTGFSAVRSWRAAWREGKNSPVPNSGIPEAAMAGALGIELGGTNFYQGVAVQTPKLGSAFAPLNRENIAQATRIMYAASLLFFLAVMAARVFFDGVFQP